jgi:hypothetical protein
MAEQDTNTAQAADQTNDQSGQATGEGTQDQGTQDQGGDKGQKQRFTKEDEQQISSWVGRIVAKQLDEKVMPHLRQTPSAPAQSTVNQDDMMKAFNEKVQEKLFSGDSVGAIEMVMNLKERVKQNVTQTQSMNLMRGITTYSDKPYYEDIQSEMQKIARERISEGYPVDAALKVGYAEAKSSFLENKIGGGGDHKGLGLSGGGRPAQRGKGPTKLPEAFELACARDIADGLYKNRDEYIKALSPKIKEAYGI